MFDNRQHKKVSSTRTRSTRRRALRMIAGVLVGTATVGVAEGRNHVTEIDGSTVIDEPGEYVLTEDISGEEGPFIRIEADRVTLNGNGHEISARYADESRVNVEVTDVKNVALSNLSIANALYCLRMTNARNCTVEEIEVTDALSETGIRCSQTDNTTFSRITGKGITIEGSNNSIQGANVEGSGIRTFGSRNRLQDNVSYSIDHSLALYNGDNNLVRNNTTGVGEQSSILLRNINNSTLVDNEISGGYNGIALEESDNNTITQNNIYSDYGIELNESDDNRVVRNTIKTWYDEGIIDNGENNRLQANTINYPRS